MTRKLDIIVVGTGRCGTKFVAKLLTSVGVSCSHETFFTPQGLPYAEDTLANHWVGRVAESSWQAVPFLDCEALRDAFVVHLVRHPKAFIESVMKIWPESKHTAWTKFIERHLPSVTRYDHVDDRPTWLAHRYAKWNKSIKWHTVDRPSVLFNIEQEPSLLLRELENWGAIDLTDIDLATVYDNRKCNAQIEHNPYNVELSDITDVAVRDEMLEVAARYGYTWEEEARVIPQVKRTPVIKAIVTTLDNLPNLRETVMVLRDEPLDKIIIVNNGSRDGTKEWLNSVTRNITTRSRGSVSSDSTATGSEKIHAIHRVNDGAGPGRNTGLDAAGDFDYVLMVDGGIRPLRGGTQKMLDYLERTPEADVVGVEIVDFETDPEKAWRRWPRPIEKAYQNTRLSHTAYCLCRASAWDNIRFCEEGPFGQPGWGADDDEMAYRWNEAGIVVHVVTCDCKHHEHNACTGAHPYRRASGSFRRLYEDTCIWPNQYGSVYEKRLVWLQQNWPQYEPGGQWGEPWLTVVVRADGIEQTARLVKAAHDGLRKRRFEPPWDHVSNPYSVVVHGGDGNWLGWAKPRHLCQHHGDAVVVGGEIVRRTKDNESTWTGDFRLWEGDDWREAVRPNAHYYGLVKNEAELTTLLATYDEKHSRQPVKKPPDVMRSEL